MTKFNKLGDIKSREKPLGGAKEVKIPPLTSDPVVGPDGKPLTMEDQAEVLRDPNNPLSPYYATNEPQMDPNQHRNVPNSPFGQILPPEAAKDPRFVKGVGSAYAVNQPHMNTANQRPPLSNETVEGIEALHKFNSEAVKAQEDALKKDDGQRMDDDPVSRFADELGLDKDYLDEIKKDQDELNSDDLKAAIEERCKPMDIIQLLEEGECRQDVPIVRDRFIPTFRTISTEEDLEIKRMMSKHKGSEIFLFDLLTVLQLVAGLYALNGRPLPSHLDDKKRLDEKKFGEKLKVIRGYPVQMVTSLSINFSWFDKRARSLFVDMGPIKNG
jgi:hypothetical protein